MFDFFRRKKKDENKDQEAYEENLEDDYYEDEYHQEDGYDDSYNEIDIYQNEKNIENEQFQNDYNAYSKEDDREVNDNINFEQTLNPNESQTITFGSSSNDSEYINESMRDLEDDLTNQPSDEYYNEMQTDSTVESTQNVDSYYDLDPYEQAYDDYEEDYYEEVEVSEPEETLGFFDRLKEGLIKTRDQFTTQVKNLFTANVKIDDELFEELEEILISADIGMNSTLEIVDDLRDEIKVRSIKNPEEIYPLLQEIMVEKLDKDNLNNDLNIKDNKLAIILVIGVNGVGKTTTIGKLAYNLKKEGKTVMLAAADTFRAAAIEQLGEWADRADVEMVSHTEGSDPSAVIFDAIKSAKSKNVDVLICDTAGRLHNKKNLMKELEKINKTIDTHAGDATRDNLLVLDATTGQNAVNQLREFKNVTDISGLVLTKLDGTAKGGIIFPLQVELDVPVKYIGLGEGIDNLEKFDSNSFVDALF